VTVSPNLVAVCRHSTSRAGWPPKAAVGAALRAWSIARVTAPAAAETRSVASIFIGSSQPISGGRANASLLRHCIAASGLTAHGQCDREVDAVAVEPAAQERWAVRRQRTTQLPDGEVDASATQVDRTRHHGDPAIDVGRLIVIADAVDRDVHTIRNVSGPGDL
jgi:hypothetical protein